MTTMLDGDQVLAQRRAHLLLANEVRTYRAQLKKDLASTKVTLTAAVLGRDPILDTMKVMDLVRAVPAVGKTKALAWMKQLRVRPDATLGGLTDRQLALLMALDHAHRMRSETYRRQRARYGMRTAA